MCKVGRQQNMPCHPRCSLCCSCPTADSQGDFSQDDEYESEGLAPSDSREEDSGSEDAENDRYRTPVNVRAGAAAAGQPARRVGAS